MSPLEKFHNDIDYQRHREVEAALKANPNFINEPFKGWAPMFSALVGRDIALVKHFLQHPNIDVNKGSERDGVVPLSIAMAVKAPEIYDLIFSHPGFDPNCGGEPPFIKHINELTTEQIDAFFKHPKFNINQLDKEGKPAISNTISWGEPRPAFF